MAGNTTPEKNLKFSLSGYLMLPVALALLGHAALLLLDTAEPGLANFGWFVLGFFVFKGLTIIAPNEAVITTFLGSYMGTVKESGFRWINPLYSCSKLSLRARNLNGQTLKVNDKSGNPIEIAAVVVWQVSDTARATFDVDDYQTFVQIQSEAAVRNLASSYAYDQHEDDHAAVTLRDATGQINKYLEQELHDRLERAGIAILEARISHLAYAPEIAHAMLQRQQAAAIVAARRQIVDGAVGMVEMALQRLQDKNTVELSSQEKAALVSNLLVVLCGEKSVSPVVNTGAGH